MTEVRCARIATKRPGEVEAYLPDNYKIVIADKDSVIIEGVDKAGWTLDGYVLPRLASGLIFGEEIDHNEEPI